MAKQVGPIDKIYDDLFERVSYDVAFEVTHASVAFTESPIERFLYGALYAATTFSTRGSEHCFSSMRKIEGVDDLRGVEYDPFVLYFSAQTQILEYRADFVIYAKGDQGEWRSLVVECDGHNFHERTKEQAARDRARDRAMQAAGHMVFRFTGSEIWRDPCGCAAQVLKWASDVTWGQP